MATFLNTVSAAMCPVLSNVGATLTANHSSVMQLRFSASATCVAVARIHVSFTGTSPSIALDDKVIRGVGSFAGLIQSPYATGVNYDLELVSIVGGKLLDATG